MHPRFLSHELRLLRRDRALWACVALAALFSLWAVGSGVSWWHTQSATLEKLSARGATELAELEHALAAKSAPTQPGTPDPADAYAVGRVQQQIVLPPRPLAALVIGQSDLLPPAIRVWLLGSAREGADQGSFKSPLALEAGRFDLAFVMLFLYPLLLIAATYDVLSGERERGTLATALAQPLAARGWLLTKLGLRALALSLPMIALALAAWKLGLGAAAEPGPWVWVWLAAAFAYGLFWLALVLAVASRGTSSAANAAALTTLWLALVVIAPPLVNLVASALYPAPSRTSFVNQLRAGEQDLRRDGVDMLARFYEDHPELVPPDENAERPEFSFPKALVLMFNEIDRIARPIEDRFETQLAAQQRLVRRLRFVSPALLGQELFNDIAGTGLARHQRFRAQVRRYEAEWKAFFTPRVLGEQPMTAADYRALPRFVFVEEETGEVLGRIATGLGGLLVLSLLIGGWALWRLRDPARFLVG